MTLTISSATIADVPALAALRTASGWEGGANAAVMARYLAGEHHPQGALSPRAAWRAIVGDQLVGYAAGHRTVRGGAQAELQWLLVAPEVRRRGVARALVLTFAAWCVAEGAQRVVINVAPENVAARRLYESLGAEPLDEYWMIWRDIADVRPVGGGRAVTRAQART